jgi:hypothetical protein
MCADCRNFIKENGVACRVPSVCITTLYECKSCGLEFELLENGKIAEIWKLGKDIKRIKNFYNKVNNRNVEETLFTTVEEELK